MHFSITLLLQDLPDADLGWDLALLMNVQVELDQELEALAEMLAEGDGVNVQALLAKAARESLSEEMLLAERTAEADRPDAVSVFA